MVVAAVGSLKMQGWKMTDESARLQMILRLFN